MSDQGAKISRRDFFKLFSLVGLVAVVPTAQAAAREESQSKLRPAAGGEQALVGQAGYARRVAALFDTAPVKRIQKT